MKVLLRRLLTLDAVSLALTCTALACLPISLRDTAPDAALTLLFPLMLVGVLGAAVIWASTRFSSAARAGFILCGLLLIFLRVGQLGSVLLAADSTLRLIAALLLPLGAAGIQLDQVGRWLAAQAVAWADVSDFAYRSWTWLAGVLRGSTAQDPAARALFLAIGIWLLSIWAGWRALTKRDVLGGLLPVTVSVAIVLDITAQNRWPLWLHVAALLFLLGLTELSRLTKSWRREHRDYSDSIPEDLLFAATLLSLLILTAAFAVSSFSLKDFIDRFRQPEPVAASASSSRHTSGGSVRTGITGLQDAHFISAGPSLTQDVVMYVSTGDLPPIQHALDAPVPRYYWRAETYQYYSGRGWHNPVRHDLQVPPGAIVIPVDADGYRLIHASVAIPGGLNGAAYWAGTLVDVDSSLDLAWRPTAGSTATLPLGASPQDVDLIGGVILPDPAASVPPGAAAYRFTALVPQPTEEQLRAASSSVPEWVVERYTQLPSSLPERVRALSRDLTARGRTPYDRALAIESYLRGIPYSLEVPGAPLEHDAVDYFLFDLKQGYCDYYATAMTVLARAAGLPARFVTGYASGSYDPLSAEYIVREADAHAWTEIYFSGIGWVEFEPTASQPLPQRSSHEMVTAPRATGDRLPERRTLLPRIDAAQLRLVLWVFPLFSALGLIWLLIDGWRLRHMSPDAATRAVYRRMRRGTRRAVGSSSVDQTALEYSRALSGRLSALGWHNQLAARLLRGIMDGVADLTRAYLLSTFSPEPLSRPDARRVVAVWGRLRWQLLALNLVLPFVIRSSARRGVRPHAS